MAVVLKHKMINLLDYFYDIQQMHELHICFNDLKQIL